MADYTKLSLTTIQDLIAEYDLGEFESMIPLPGGQANSSVKISTQTGTYTLSVCDEKNQDEIYRLPRVLTYLEARGFPCTRLVTTRNGAPFIHHKTKPVYVKTFLTGDVCRNLSSKMLIQVGHAMAKLHALAPPPDLPDRFPYGLESFDELLDIEISHPYVDWLQAKKEFLTTAIDPTMARGFIHGDIFWDNLVFADNTLVAILDFEEACTYYKLYDLGMAAVGCCARNKKFSMDQIKQLIQGYKRICPLTGPEKQQLKLFMEYAAVAASFWRFRQYNLRHPSPDKKNNYLELSCLADQVHTMGEHQFNDIFRDG
jgi:homoserine kinase type II